MRKGHESPPTLDYHRPEAPAAEPSDPLAWQIRAAYVVMALPLVYVGFEGAPNPVPIQQVLTTHVLAAIAVGAALFIVRRRPRNVVGWIGLVCWGGLTLTSLVTALVR